MPLIDRLRRSVLYVPVTNERALAKLPPLDCDARLHLERAGGVVAGTAAMKERAI
jgi:hypothetical protein